MLVEDKVVGRFLALLAQGLEPGDSLLQSRPEYWRVRWNQAVHRLELTELGVKPYSLRRGGSTVISPAEGSYDRTVERGRWTQVTTARLYLDKATASLSELVLPDTTRQLLSSLRQMIYRICGQVHGGN